MKLNMIMSEIRWSVLDETENKWNEMFRDVSVSDLGLSSADIEKAVIEAKATVDSAYVYSRREWVACTKWTDASQSCADWCAEEWRH